MNGHISNFHNITNRRVQVRFNSASTDLFAIKTSDKIAVLATNEYEGIFKNGGIGTYYKSLSENLTSQGWYVILVLAFAKHSSSQKLLGNSHLPAVKHIFATDDVCDFLELQPIQQQILTTAQTTNEIIYHNFAYTFFLQALSQQFPENLIYVEFQEMTGLGFITNQAKQCGILPKNCLTAVTMHSGHEWLVEANEKYILDEEPRSFWQKIYWERVGFEHADLAFFPSYFLKSKVDEYGWDTSQAKNLPYFIPILDLDQSIPVEISQLEPGKIPVVFFGRLEERKGLCVFVEAIQALNPEIQAQIEVIFIGKIVSLQSSRLKFLDSQQYIDEQLAHTQIKYQIFADFYSQQALQFIGKLNHPVVCLTSHQENFPNTSLEMGQLPVSLVVSQTGGFQETLKLINRTAGVYWFQPRDVMSLAQTLTIAITNHDRTYLVPQPNDLRKTNQDLFTQRMTAIDVAFQQPSPVREEVQPKVTVAITANFSSDYLIDCLSSLSHQTYPQLDVLILEDASTSNDKQEISTQAKSLFPQFRFISSLETNLDLATKYDYLASLAEGDYFLAISPHHLLMPFAIECLVNAGLNSSASMIVCPSVADYASSTQMSNLCGGELPIWLQSTHTQDVCTFVKTSLVQKYSYLHHPATRTPNINLLVTGISTGEKVVFYPYPLYECYSLNDPSSDDINSLRYHLRQSLGKIPPFAWTNRQQYMLITACEQLSSQNERSQQQIQRLDHDLVYAQSQLELARQRITAIETSKFWQLRSRWFKIKRKLGLPTNE